MSQEKQSWWARLKEGLSEKRAPDEQVAEPALGPPSNQNPPDLKADRYRDGSRKSRPYKAYKRATTGCWG